MPKACPYKSVKALLWNDDIFMHRNSGLTNIQPVGISDRFAKRVIGMHRVTISISIQQQCMDARTLRPYVSQALDK